MFCAHKRLRTSCPECRPPPPPPRPDAPRARKARTTAASDPESGLSGKGVAPDAEPARARAKRVKPPTRAEAERAEAWWVNKK